MSGLAESFRGSRLRGALSSSGSASKPSEASVHKSTKKVITQFPFFNLPRELRDRVYSMALVAPMIEIDFVPCASDDDDKETRSLHPQPKFRTTYTSLGKKMTYRLQKHHECDCGACPAGFEPQVQLFYVNRTVYEEAKEIFYTQNEFNAVLGSGLGCSAFFNDRSSALSLIRSLSFDVPLHTADFNYGRWSDTGNNALFATIKEKTAIRHLSLNFHGLVPDVSKDEWRCPCDCQAFEHPLLAIGHAMGMPGVPTSKTKRVHAKEWALFKTMTSVNNLSRLTINIDFCYHMLDHDNHDETVFDHEHVRNFVTYMRSRMLKNGEALNTTQIHGYCRIQDEDSDKRYRFHSDDDEYGKSHLKIKKLGHKFHPHQDSGSEGDAAHLTYSDSMSDEEEEWDDYDDNDGEYDSDEDMPPLEDDSSDEDEEMPPLGDSDVV